MSQEKLTKIAEGREAEIFAWEDGTVLRLLRSQNAAPQLEMEAAAMEAARSSGVRVPAVHGTTQAMGRPGTIMERVDGPDGLTLIGQRPWKLFELARVTGEMHARLHACTAPASLRPVRPAIKAGLQTSKLIPEHLARFAEEVLDGLPDGDQLCHGDYHPGNFIVTEEAPVLIDWTATCRGDAAADIAQTRLLLDLGEPPPGTPALLRLLISVARKLFASAYWRSYQRVRPVDADTLSRWEVPVAATRLTYGIESERPALLRILEGRAELSASA